MNSNKFKSILLILFSLLLVGGAVSGCKTKEEKAQAGELVAEYRQGG